MRGLIQKTRLEESFAFTSLASLADGCRGVFCGRGEDFLELKPEVLFWDDPGGLDDLAGLKPLKSEEGRTAKGRACHTFVIID